MQFAVWVFPCGGELSPGQSDYSSPSNIPSRSRSIPILIPEPQGAQVKVSGESAEAKARSCCSVIDDSLELSEMNRPSVSCNQPRCLSSITPFAIRSHSGIGSVVPALSMSRESRVLLAESDAEMILQDNEKYYDKDSSF